MLDEDSVAETARPQTQTPEGSHQHATVSEGGPRAGSAPTGRPGLAGGDVLADRYVIEQEIGRGGSGIVFRAHDRLTAQTVALKVLDPDRYARPPGAERLIRELRYGRSIQHPNIRRVYDAFETDGRCFLTMEYAAGGSIREEIGELTRARPIEQRLDDIKAIVAGVAAIHEAGLVHGDLKPENVLRMADGRLVVSDLGLARALDRATTISGLGGTPGYLAPELLRDDTPTQAADVWALGVMIHEICFGTRPWWERSGRRERLRVSDGDDFVAAEVAVSLIARTCLSSALARRPGNAGEVARSLAQAQAGPPGGRAWRFAAVAAAGILVVGALALTRLSIRGRRERVVPGPPGQPQLIGVAKDWSGARILAKVQVSCLEALPPERSVVRIFSREGPSVIDLDIATGHSTPAPLLPETYKKGCPTLSQDGSSLLFTRTPEGGTPEIMFSRNPTGKDPVRITSGSDPVWLPSGRQFVFKTGGSLALGDLDRNRFLFPLNPRKVEYIRSVAVNATGDRIAVVQWYGPAEPLRESSIEVYALPSLLRQQSVSIPGPAGDVAFDSARQAFQVQTYEGLKASWTELSASGRLVRLGNVPGALIVGAVHSRFGLVLTTVPWPRTFLITPQGEERDPIENAREISVSRTGDIAFIRTIGTGGRAVGIRTLRDHSVHMLSDGPDDGAPDIALDGQSAVYLRSNSGEIVRCALNAGDSRRSCETIHVDKSARALYAVRLSPAADQIAYVTGEERDGHPVVGSVRILSLHDRLVRDLGPMDIDCGARWSSPNTIWTRPRGGRTWVEVDTHSGLRTGKTWTSESKEIHGRCAPPPDGNPYRIRVDFRPSEVRLVERL
jgi:hypothetical protein